MPSYKYQSDKWDEWMRKALAGDKHSYRLLLNDLQPWLSAYFGKRIADEAAHDLTQETLLSLHAKRHTYDPNQAFGPWISAVARHRMIDYFRKTGRVDESVFDESYQGIQNSHGQQVRDKIDVQRLLLELNEEQAKVIDLVKLQQYSIKEAAEKTGHSESSVKVMIHRGIKKMAAIIETGKKGAK